MRNRELTVVALLLLAGCSSGGYVSDAVEVGAGSPISMDVTRVQGTFAPNERPIEISVEVSNNSDHDLTVDRIDIQRQGGTAAFDLTSATLDANQLISPGEDHTFEVGGFGRLSRELAAAEPRRIRLRVMVLLTNGDRYFGSFEAEVSASRY